MRGGRNRLLLQLMRGVGVVIVCMGLLLGLAIYAILSISRTNETLYTVLDFGQIADRLHTRLADQQRNFGRLGGPQSTYNPSTYHDIATQIEAELGSLIEKADRFSPGSRAALNNLQTLYIGGTPSLRDQLAALNARVLTNRASATYDWINSLEGRLAAVVEASERLSARLTDDSAASIADSRQIQGVSVAGLMVLSLLGISLALLLSWSIIRRPVLMLQTVTGNLAQVAAGNLAQPTDLVVKTDAEELSRLHETYLSMVTTLRTLIRQTQETAERIAESAAEIESTAAQQVSSSQQQAGAIAEITVTVEQLNATAGQIAEAASSVSEAADQALVSANRGQDAVRDSILGMAATQSRVQDIIARILALNSQTIRIGEVADLINTIAAQTHILALNAAVESAGAGHYGERFGVVAVEVKKLAQRSASATQEIRQIIGQIQAATTAAVMATEDGLKETDRGVALAHQSGDANEDIISMVARTVQLAQAINLATQQQRTASDQVVLTMHGVAEVTGQAAAISRQTLEIVRRLSEVAHELDETTHRFQLATGEG